MTSENKKTISLVLGSGGARGLAHIGVIRWLEENNVEIKSISGSSVGAMVGGVYAAGKLDEFEEWVRAITKLDIITLLDISWRKSGLVKGEKVINTLKELVGDLTIDELPIKFTAVASDILNEKEVWMNSGKLFDAIRASISLPLFFTPFPYRGVDLIDGGVLNPVPIAPTFGDGNDITIAVNLGGQVEVDDTHHPETTKSKKNGNSEEKKSSAFTQKINSFIESLKGSSDNGTHNNWGVYDVANQAFDAMQSTIARHKLATYPPDFSVEIARNACGILELNRADEMIKLGYQKAEEYLHDKI